MLNKLLAKSTCILCCIGFLQINNLKAQTELQVADTLKLDIKTAEKMFLDKNLSLLAAHYNIKSNEELVIQARKWDNPILATDQNVYSDGQWFQHGKDAAGNPTGQFYVQVQQLIKTAGKRGKQINLAKTNVNIAEWQFKSTMRNLRAQLLQDLYTVAQLEGNAKLYNDNMQRLNKLMTGMQAEFNAGNIAKKEYLRVSALLVGLQQDMTDNAKSLNDVQAELKTMLQITGNTFIEPILPEEEATNTPDISFMAMVDSAKIYNTDYQSEVYQLQYQKQNLKLQKALAIPDITFGPEFDQNSNYTPNYYGLGISLPLPVWDRNQGNIRSSRYQVKAEEANMLSAEQKLHNDVMNAYQKLLMTLKLSSNQNLQFYKDYYQLFKNITESYNNRQISLLEFLDYFNDYEDIRQKELQQILNLRLAKQNLNDVVGIDIIN